MNAGERCCPACAATGGRAAFRAAGFDHLRCRDCGTLYVSPLPSTAVTQATYLRLDYHQTAAASAPRMRAEAEARVQRIAAMGARRILEIGCGPGHFLDAARACGLHIEGVDPANTATAASQRGHLVHDIWLEDFEPDAPFDALALWEVIEHLPDPLESLSRATRWLRPRGIVALSTPSSSGVAARLLGRRFPMVSPPDHLELFSRRGLSRLLARAGLRIEYWRSFSNLTPEVIARGLRRFVLGNATEFDRAISMFSRWGTAPAQWIDRAGLGTSFEVYARLT